MSNIKNVALTDELVEIITGYDPKVREVQRYIHPVT